MAEIRNAIQRDGRSARNLVAYSVPVDAENNFTENNEFSVEIDRKSSRDELQVVSIYSKNSSDEMSLTEPPRHSRINSYNYKQPYPVRQQRAYSGRKHSGQSPTRFEHVQREKNGRGDLPRNKSGIGKKHESSDAKSASLTSMDSNSGQKLTIRARYWKYLFDNLHRAVDEIYETCREDKNPNECKEAVLILEAYEHDFKALVEWINLEKRLEQADKVNLPTALAWEVRKTTPVRSNNPSGSSWADKVRVKNTEPETPITEESGASTTPITPPAIEIPFADESNVQGLTLNLDQTFEATQTAPQTPRSQIGEVVLHRQNSQTDALDEFCTPNACWAELCEMDEQLRQPGGAAKIHEKLSSPSRRKTDSSEEARKRYEERHERAEKRRREIENNRLSKKKESDQRNEEVRVFHDKQAMQRRQALEIKLAKADETRQEHLNSVRQAAHTEGTVKIQEIGLISAMDEDIRKKEKLQKIKVHEDQFAQLMLERQQEKDRLQLEKSEREKAAEERRLAMERERTDWLKNLADRRKVQEDRIRCERQQQDKEREIAAQKRKEDREQKVREIELLQEERSQRLREKIATKSKTWEKRKNEVLSAKREKAVELSAGNMLYCSMDSGMPSTVTASQVTPPKVGRARSLPASPRVHSSMAISIDTDKETVRANLFKREPQSDSETNLPSPVLAKPGSSPRLPACDEILKPAKTTPVPAQPSSSLNDPVSLYFMTEKSIENLQKMADFEKMLKKRLKKIRTRMNARANKLETDSGSPTSDAPKLPPSANRNKISKALKEIERVMVTHDPTANVWPDQKVKQVDRAVRDLLKIVALGETERTTFRLFKGFQTLVKIISLTVTMRSLSSISSSSLLSIKHDQSVSPLPDRTILNICKVLRVALTGESVDNVKFVLMMGIKCAAPVIDRMNQLLKAEEINARIGSASSSHLPSSGMAYNIVVFDDIISELIGLICQLLDSARLGFSSNKLDEQAVDASLDLISYIVSVGTIDLLSDKLKRVRTSIDEAHDTCAFIINTASTVSVVSKLLIAFHGKSSCDIVRTHFMQACEQVDFAAIIPVLYTVLVLSVTKLEPRPTIFDGSQFGDDERENSLLKKDQPNKVPLSLAKVSYVCLQCINAEFSLGMRLENICSPDMTRHLFRHIFNYLLWHLIRTDENNNKNHNLKHTDLETDILCELITLIGHFTINSRSRQDFLASGVQPTVLAQLCALPFSFFNDTRKRSVLIPTLFALCFENEQNIEFIKRLDMSTALFREVIDSMTESPIFRNVKNLDGFWKRALESNF